MKPCLQGFLYNFNDLKDLENKLKVLIADKNSLGKISKDNIKKAKQFLWNNTIEGLEKVYKGMNTKNL